VCGVEIVIVGVELSMPLINLPPPALEPPHTPQISSNVTDLDLA
jgi:hypothetical protein